MGFPTVQKAFHIHSWKLAWKLSLLCISIIHIHLNFHLHHWFPSTNIMWLIKIFLFSVLHVSMHWKCTFKSVNVYEPLANWVWGPMRTTGGYVAITLPGKAGKWTMSISAPLWMFDMQLVDPKETRETWCTEIVDSWIKQTYRIDSERLFDMFG